jgi:hypothetical protein
MTARRFCIFTTSLFLLAFSVEGQPKPMRSPQKEVSLLPTAAAPTATIAPGVLPPKTREPWQKTKAFASEDPAIYRPAVAQRLKELGEEIAQMKQQSDGLIERGYYIMRLNALEQHQKYAERQLAELPQAEIKKGKDSLRSRLDTIIIRLEAHLDLTREEGKDFILVE